jgi:hypothetical protein
MTDGMNIRRRVPLNKYCLKCGEKMFRYLLGKTANDGDDGDCVIQTAVADCCTNNCIETSCESPVANFPLPDMEKIFDNWEAGNLTREKFDEQVTAQLERASVYWTLTETG